MCLKPLIYELCSSQILLKRSELLTTETELTAITQWLQDIPLILIVVIMSSSFVRCNKSRKGGLALTLYNPERQQLIRYLPDLFIEAFNESFAQLPLLFNSGHCEKQSDVAILWIINMFWDCFASLAMTIPGFFKGISMTSFVPKISTYHPAGRTINQSVNGRHLDWIFAC